MSSMLYRRILCAIFIIPLLLIGQDINEAIRLFNASQFEQAREMFIQIIKDVNNPRIAEAYYYMGRLSIDPDSGLHYYNRVVKNYPQARYADVAYLEIAKINIARKKYQGAIITLNELVRNYPETSMKDEIMFWLGVSYVSSGKESEGISILKELRSAYPKSVWSERALAIIPSSDTPVPSTEYFTVQVGSYRNKSNADNYAAEMQGKGFEAVHIVEAVVKGNTYYRVWVGKFSSIDEAKTFSQKLESMGIKGNVVKGY